MGKISPCFHSPQMEHAFRQHTLGEDKKRAWIVFCLTILAGTIFFFLNYQSLGSEPIFTKLAIVRGILLLLVVILLIAIPRIRDEKRFDLLLLGFCMAVAFTNYYVTGYRPGGYTPAAMSDIIVILAMYLLVPVRLMYKSIPALFITLLSPSLWDAPSVQTGYSLMAYHLTCHVIGFIFHTILNRSKRVQFYLLIKDRKLKENLEESERKYRYVMDNINIGVVVLQDNKLVFVNRDTIDTLKQSEKQILKHPDPYFYVDPEDRSRVIENQARLLDGEGDRIVEVVRTISPDKDHRWLECTSLRVFWDQKPATLNILKNITKTKNLENELKFINERLNVQNKTLTSAATRDVLTGIHNRRALYEYMEEQWSRSVRTQSDSSIIMLDIDWFKSINDTHGHPAGDMVLKGMAQLIDGMNRNYDRFGRWGGEEFMLYLPDTDLVMAKGIAERIRARVAETKFQAGEGLDLEITVSLGVASRCGSDTLNLDTLIGLADKSLYRAKEGGRNQVVTT